MKTPLACLFCALVAPLAALAANTPFEGKVSFTLAGSGGKGQELRYALKNGRMRLEMPTAQGTAAMIVDPEKKETIMLMDEQKMYMTMAMPASTAAATPGKGEEATIVKSGETEKILGFLAEKYVSTTSSTKTELWLAEGLGTFVGMGTANPMSGRGRGGPAPQGWERALTGRPLFPLRVVSRDQANKETFRMEVTAIEKQTLPDALFAPPADYKKFDMGAMMKGAMPGLRPGGN